MTDSSSPRAEYPRPQFVRPDWLSLNGAWEFAFDDADEGQSQGWSDGRALPLTIQVPFAYQASLSGVGEKAIHERVWYARSFEIPEAWRTESDPRDVLLHFGAVDFRTTVWINGAEVGHNQGGHVPFTFDIAPYLAPGVNRITLRVEDPQDPHLPRGKQATSGLPRGCDYYCTTGIWQSVWLEPVSPVRIDDIRLRPVAGDDPELDALDVQVYLHAPSTGWQIEVDVLEGENVTARAADAAAGAAARFLIPLPRSRRWSPDDPFLYGLRVRLRNNGDLLDEIEAYAGIRSVRCAGGRMILNGEPVFLAMALDQGYWPDGGMTAPTDEALRADVEWCRQFGFNGARKHQKVEDPRWLYWCDRLGLLVWGEMPNARAWSTRAEELFLAEWERAVRRDFNHPCIITWVPVNESWGAPNLHQNHSGQYAFLERIVSETRRLDPDRPVVDNDGWEHTDVGDICAIHDYTVDPELLKARYVETMTTGAPPEQSWGSSPKMYFASGSRYRGQPIVLSEVGGLLMQPDAPPEQWDWLYGMYGSCRSPEELLQKYGALIDCLAGFPFLAGFCYTQLTDVEQEMNGLLTYDRKAKVDPAAIAKIHQVLPGFRKSDPER